MPGPRDPLPTPAEPARAGGDEPRAFAGAAAGGTGDRVARLERALADAEAECARLAGELERSRLARVETASILSHDLRNPLGAMLIGVQRLERLADGPRREQTLGVLEKLERSIRGMNRLLDEIVDLSRLECGTLPLQRRPAPVRAMVLRAVERLAGMAGERGQAVHVDCPEDLPAGAWDPDRVTEALAHLLSNAIQFGPAGGTIHVSAALEGGAVRFAVRDEGPGLSPQSRQQLFDRWWRPPPGSPPRCHGLGLFLVRGIAEAHGGRAWVESEQGRGSTFLFSLPLGPP